MPYATEPPVYESDTHRRNALALDQFLKTTEPWKQLPDVKIGPRLGVSGSTISRYRRHGFTHRERSIGVICAGLGIDEDSLCERQEIRPRTTSGERNSHHHDPIPPETVSVGARELCTTCGRRVALGYSIPRSIFDAALAPRVSPSPCIVCFATVADTRRIPWDRHVTELTPEGI